MNRDPKYYLKLPYGRVWEWREDDAEPYWVVRLVEIPEVVGDGATHDEAEAALRPSRRMAAPCVSAGRRARGPGTRDDDRTCVRRCHAS